MVILKWILKKQYESVDWINFVQVRDHWWAVVYTVMNLGVPSRRGIS
jgi:hypothetical protein